MEMISHTSSHSRSVPVIRIFGTTPAGQKCCLHVHGVFPYLWILLDEEAAAEKGLRKSEYLKGDRNDYLDSLKSEIDTALRDASQASRQSTGKESYRGQHWPRVHRLTIHEAKTLYGYSPGSHYFVKIELFDPNDVAKVATLLLQGNTQSFYSAYAFLLFCAHFIFLSLTGSIPSLIKNGCDYQQPHESHVPFLLQFMVSMMQVFGIWNHSLSRDLTDWIVCHHLCP